MCLKYLILMVFKNVVFAAVDFKGREERGGGTQPLVLIN